MLLRALGILCLWIFTTSSSLSNALADIGDNGESHSVIISYGHALSPAAKQSRQADEQEKIAQLHSAMAKGFAQRSRHLKYSGMLAAEVSAQELQTLLADPDVQVFPNRLHKPLLAQSVQRVYSSQGVSPFHGDNEWTVAVLDTGVDKSHPFLAGKVVSEACYSNGGALPQTSSLCPGGGSSSTANNSALPCTLAACDHGTRVAGIAAGNGASFDGVARDAKLLPIQIYSRVQGEEFCFPFTSCIGAFTSDIIAALERIYELRNTFSIAAVNLSFGSSELFSGTCDDQPEKPIVDLLRAANIPVIAASGNSGNTSMMTAPACISSVIAVAATGDNSDVPFVGDGSISGNNTSTALDLFAPGVNITSSVPGGGFATATGTSFAAPHVAGALAAMRHAAPSLSAQAAENLLKSNGPLVTQNSISRRRLDLRDILEVLVPGSQSGGAVLSPIYLLLLGEE